MRSVAAVSALVVALMSGVLLGGCSNPQQLTAAERGRQVYMSNCIVCHNPDPTQPGSQGPEVAGSSKELVEARVLHATYPSGYTPKRNTKQMVALPHLVSRIDDLTAFLAAAKDGTH